LSIKFWQREATFGVNRGRAFESEGGVDDNQVTVSKSFGDEDTFRDPDLGSRESDSATIEIHGRDEVVAELTKLGVREFLGSHEVADRAKTGVIPEPDRQNGMKPFDGFPICDVCPWVHCPSFTNLFSNRFPTLFFGVQDSSPAVLKKSGSSSSSQSTGVQD